MDHGINSTTQAEHENGPPVKLYVLSTPELVIWCILYASIALLAVLGNLLVLYVTLFRLRVRTITTYFIINLGLADLFTAIFAIPFKFQAALFQKWYLPDYLCKIVPYTETVTLSVSVFTLTVSAVHEFRTVFFPRCHQLKATRARCIVFAIWVFAIIISLPHGLYHDVYPVEDEENTTINQCLPVYAEEDWWKFYNVYLTIIHYFFPMIILDGAYTMIAIKLIKMLIIVVACFSLCWFPLETYLLLNELKPKINSWKYINVLFFCAHWLAMSNSGLNPVIYFIFNRKYNHEFRRFFRKFRCQKLTDKEKNQMKTSDDETNESTEGPLTVKRTWPNPYTDKENVPYYSEEFQVVLKEAQREVDVLTERMENR